MISDFLDIANRLRRSDVAGRLQVFDDVFDAIADLRGVYEKADINRDNIEELFSAIEMADLLGKLGNRDEDSIENLRNSLVTLIYKTIEESMLFRVVSLGQTRTFQIPVYDRFAEMLVEAAQAKSGDLSWCSIITFNYDIALDLALVKHGVPHSYCLDGESMEALPYLKLHGSINWGVCPECDTINYRSLQVRLDPLFEVGPRNSDR